MGFLPFVNEGGRRVIRWPWLFLAWIGVLLACLAGTAVAAFALVGDWGRFLFEGVVLGVYCCAWLTVQGLTLPVENLPPWPPPRHRRAANVVGTSRGRASKA